MSIELIEIEVTKQPDNPHQPRVVYVPPSDELLVEYAHEMCQNWGYGFQSPEVEAGLVAFLRVWAHALARELTAKHNGGFDSRIE